ncbi:hypothetical protein EGR_03350 [Echinococcus granulosus]|uniref:Uncharacterized protein n=1 Tax=Echinococcus granulosus TaxID=6210 RepID=W6V602_ECHGR|nr:hypothetical protein EGR_03350 [Echinococcus granulosus]EUB61804.1 hypothetical protein EGR_03350 [Echinococcus granulosus]
MAEYPGGRYQNRKTKYCIKGYSFLLVKICYLFDCKCTRKLVTTYNLIVNSYEDEWKMPSTSSEITLHHLISTNHHQFWTRIIRAWANSCSVVMIYKNSPLHACLPLLRIDAATFILPLHSQNARKTTHDIAESSFPVLYFFWRNDIGRQLNDLLELATYLHKFLASKALTIRCHVGKLLRCILNEKNITIWNGILGRLPLAGIEGLHKCNVPISETFTYRIPVIKPFLGGTFCYHLPHFLQRILKILRETPTALKVILNLKYSKLESYQVQLAFYDVEVENESKFQFRYGFFPYNCKRDFKGLDYYFGLNKVTVRDVKKEDRELRCCILQKLIFLNTLVIRIQYTDENNFEGHFPTHQVPKKPVLY